jgi:NAD(P)H-flavin reductase
MDSRSEVASGRTAHAVMLPHPYRVVRRWNETADTFTMELQPAQDGAPDAGPAPTAPAFRPGQFNMLYAFGAGEVPISISGDPADGERLIHTVRAVGAVTRRLSALGPGDTVGVRGPFGSAWPVEAAEGRDLVIVAGGIGLPPLRPVLYQVLSQRERFGRVALLYGARRPKEMVFVDELRSWRSRLDLDVAVTVDRATENWKGSVGFVTSLVGRAPVDTAEAVAMVCGPELMMRFAALELLSRGVAEERIYVSMERNMKCGVGLCGHCQFGPSFVCRDGPVYPFGRVKDLLQVAEA